MPSERRGQRARRLWPRGITDPLTDADHRALDAYTRREVRHKEQALHATASPQPDGGSTQDDRSERDDEATAR